MKILCTFPGRAGDLLWALPTVRAISEQFGGPVDLLIAGEFASMVPLLQMQPYLDRIEADSNWSMSHGWQPPGREDVISPYDRIFHLGYRRWPALPLPEETYRQFVLQWYAEGGTPETVTMVDLARPWITVDGPGIPLDLAVGFTEAWFELKLGLLLSVEQQLVGGPTLIQLTPPHSRWTSPEVPPGTVAVFPCGWRDAARAIRNSDLFFGDCSALHVLALALGKRCVICEPMEARWNEIFYPLGKIDRVHLVLGNDGRPTFDARACAAAIRGPLR